jgi:multidrug efflux system membrane fusion protein
MITNRSDRILPAILLLGFSALASAAAPAGAGGRGGGEGPVPVTVEQAARRAMPRELQTFGVVEPSASVAVRSQVSGPLAEVKVAEGQMVAAGDLLFTIDPRPFEAARQAAEAGLARDRVLHENARREADRQASLLEKGLTPPELAERAQAQAASLAASVLAGQAAVSNALLQLEYCRLRAPIGGRAGERLVDAGNLVRANEQTLITLNRIDPIEVRFTVPERDLAAIRRGQAAGPLAVTAQIPGEGGTATGAVTFLDNAVDRQTGTILLKGTFANADGRLWPGLHVDVVLTLEVQADALVVPYRAIQSGQPGTYVFVVQADQTVALRPVKVDRRRGEDVVVASGLEPGETVVTDGHMRLVPGAKVAIKGPAARP